MFRMFQYFSQNIARRFINKNLQIDNSIIVMYFNYKQIQNKIKLEVTFGNFQYANYVIVQNSSIHFQFLQSSYNDYKLSYTL